MKKSFKIRRIAFALTVAILMALPSLTAFADSWDPVDPYGCPSLGYAKDEETLRVISLFVSNFAEAGLPYYNSSTDSTTVNNCLLKHLELNASQFKDRVKVYKDENGQQYMIIEPELFEKRGKQLFGRNVRAEDCAGYENGKICVTADHANDPIDIVAILEADRVGYIGNYKYEADFSVYRVRMGSAAALYGSTYYIDPGKKADKLYEGTAVFEYRGNLEATTFNTWDLNLVSYSVSGTPIANSGTFGDNIAYTSKNAETTSTTAAETTESTTKPSDTTTSKLETDEEEAEKTKATVQDDSESKKENRFDSSKLMIYLLILICVILVVGFSALIILRIVNKH